MPTLMVNNAELFFDVYGSKLRIEANIVYEKPTLLLLHGGHGMVDHTLYVDFWSQFSDIAQVIFLDQRGCGRSDRRDPSEWNLHQWGKDVFDFCKLLNIVRPIVAGISTGGHVMCEYATRYPQHPGCLIFCNTEAKQNIEWMLEKFESFGNQDAAQIARQFFNSPTPAIVKAYQDHCVPLYAKRAYQPEEIQRCWQNLEVFEYYCKNELGQFDYSNELHKILCPVLLMAGEKSPGHPPKSAKAMANKIDSQLVTYYEFEGAGAPVYNDAPIESERVVRKFITINGGDKPSIR
jgi:proline iminopeptidase